MNQKAFSGEVKKIIPVAVYNGRVYTQNVKIQTDRGSNIIAFDRRKCSADMVNQPVHFELSVETLSDIASCECKAGIFPLSESNGPYADLCGNVVEVLENGADTPFILDVGEGHIQVEINSEIEGELGFLENKDTIYINDANIHLKEIRRIK